MALTQTYESEVPTYGYADGDGTEWTAADYWANLHLAHNESKALLDEVYLRYLCLGQDPDTLETRGYLYVYVKTVHPDYVISCPPTLSADNHFVKISGTKRIDANEE